MPESYTTRRTTVIVEKQKWIRRADLRQNRHKAYLFGDNILEKGLGGQAKEMRGEFNAFGVPTKWIPSMNAAAFFCDDDLDLLTKHYDRIFRDLKQSSFQIVVIPADGIGTGLARLDKTAPKIFAYLQEKLKELETHETTNKSFGEVQAR